MDARRPRSCDPTRFAASTSSLTEERVFSISANIRTMTNVAVRPATMRFRRVRSFIAAVYRWQFGLVGPWVCFAHGVRHGWLLRLTGVANGGVARQAGAASWAAPRHADAAALRPGAASWGHPRRPGPAR